MNKLVMVGRQAAQHTLDSVLHALNLTVRLRESFSEDGLPEPGCICLWAPVRNDLQGNTMIAEIMLVNKPVYSSKR